MKMKKTLCRVLCAVCALAMVLPVIFSVTASAASTKYIQSYYYPTKTLIGEELPYNQLSDQNGNPAQIEIGENQYTLIKATHGTDGVAGGPGRPHCSELWDAVSRYIYTALQGGSIMRGWMKDERVMIACCSDGTRPVIVKLERLDYCAAYLEGSRSREDDLRIAAALQEIPAVQEIIFREHYAEIYLEHDLPEETIRQEIGRASCRERV